MVAGRSDGEIMVGLPLGSVRQIDYIHLRRAESAKGCRSSPEPFRPSFGRLVFARGRGRLVNHYRLEELDAMSITLKAMVVPLSLGVLTQVVTAQGRGEPAAGTLAHYALDGKPRWEVKLPG